jgi:thioester reductase-like protein
LVVLRADLRGNRLGIDGKHYEKLAAGIEAVLHSAANVKHYGVYDELYKDNVEATEHLLEFAITARKKDFHFISTLDTGRGEIPGKPYLVFTESCHDMGQNIDHLYIKSKIAAEKKVLDYRDKGLNALIYRVGNVTFHSDSGRFQQNIENNAFYAVMRGIIKVGFFSENMKNIEFNLSFVNHTARAIVLLLSRRFHKETFHIANPHTIHMKEMEAFLKRLGFTIKNWPEVRKEFARGEADREYENIIERVKLDAWAWEEKPVTLTVPKVDRTVKLLEQLGFKWPGVTEAHIKRMMDWCREVGFI